jgi:alpha-tubulin suppressor-like RCC1 family protein
VRAYAEAQNGRDVDRCPGGARQESNMIRFRILALLAILPAVTPCGGATPMPAAGYAHSLALHADGTVRSWGEDGKGELGIGSVLFRRQPQPVAGLPAIRADAASIAAGPVHALVIARDGSVWAWGSNFAGELGDGSTTTRTTPVRAANVTNAVAVAAGFAHSLAIAADGTVWTWGASVDGALGDPGLRGIRTKPARIDFGNAAAVSAGQRHSLVLKGDGTVWAFGANNAGQLGDGSSTQRSSPVRVTGLSGIAAISAGAHHNLALKNDGTVWAWGLNDQGQLGDGTTTNRPIPVQVPGVTAVAVAAGQEFETSSLALRSDGAVWRWGSRTGPSPALVEGYVQVRQIDAGNNFSVAALTDGSVWTEGRDNQGTLGREASNFIPSGPAAGALPPGPIPGLNRVSAVAAGSFFALAVLDDGRIYTWGDDANGTLASGRSFNRTTPARVIALSSVTQVAAGGGSLALRSDGTVATWGAKGERTSAPRSLAGPRNIIQIASGEDHGVALASDNRVWTWGFNDYGQLGHGPFGGVSGSDPGIVAGVASVTRVAAGLHHTLAVQADGTVWAWGRNNSGSLGVLASAMCLDRATAVLSPCTPNPTQVPGIGSVIDVATSTGHTLALRSDGTVWAWGENSRGALGVSAGPARTTPVPVPGLSDVVQIAAGGDSAFHFSVALKRDGSVWTWGDNVYGQLGGERQGFRSTPARVDSLGSITRISAGARHVFALRSDGVLWGWGGNGVGQVGDGTVADRSRPVIVVREDGAGSFDAGDWYLDLDLGAGASVALDKAFPLVAEGSIGETDANVSAQFRVRAADDGKAGSTYVFALAPQGVVMPAADGAPPTIVGKAGKDTPTACVLAQLNASGQLQAVSSSSLQAAVTGVLSAQGQAVSVLNGVPIESIAGATFFVGYGSSSASMLSGGVNRSVASAPGAQQCRPQPPQKGWWWNPAQDGRGFSIEQRGNNLFFAAFLYDESGRSTWLVASGPTSLDGSLFTGDLLEARGGQTLGGPYPGFPTVRSVGPITLAFNTASEGTMVWPGGTVPLQRFTIVPNGLSLAPLSNIPESGWWWNEQEAGRGFFLEWQGPTLDIAGYMYDEAGNPVWYITVGDMAASGRSFSGNWWSYGNGMTLMGPWKPHMRTSDNVAPMTINFTGPDTAIMTLPNGRTTSLVRHRF